MGCCICLFDAYSLIPPTTCPGGIYTWLHWRQSRTPGSLTLVSVTTKHILLQWACNRHLSMVELPNATRQTGKTEPGDLLRLRQGLLLDHSGMEGLSSRIIFESSGLTEAGITTLLWFLVFALWLYYLNGFPALRSFIYMDVGEPTSHPCSMTGMIQDHHLPALQDFESLGTTMSGICNNIAKQY